MRRKPGNPQLDLCRNSDVSQANRRRVELADDFAQSMKAAIGEAVVDLDIVTYGGIARWLNENGHRTRRGAMWSARQVGRLVRRLKALTPTGGRRIS